MSRSLVPAFLAVLLAGCASGGDQPTGTSELRTTPTTRNTLDNQCLRELGQSGAMFTPLPDRYIAQGCTNLNTVQLSSWPSDRASLVATNLGPVTCEVSQAFVGWARFGVDRAAQQILGSPLRSIETMGSYSCRNVAGSGRRSGHATGAAIDVGAFVLEDGRRITVKAGWSGGSSREREFLRTVRKSACKRFGTVLSPDYNAAHHDHLHVEGVTGGAGYCR
jgi:hypothetical protein